MEYKRIWGLTKRNCAEEKRKSWEHHKKSISIKKDIRYTYIKINKLQGKFISTQTLRVNTNSNDILT